MADKLRNESTITLAGQERTMRADFQAIRGIESELKTDFVPLAMQMAQSRVGLNHLVVIIANGLKGNGDTRLSREEIGEAIMQRGILKVTREVNDFMSIALGDLEDDAKKDDAPAEA